MKILYIATIKENPGTSLLDKYAGKEIYLYKYYPRQHNYYGRLFNNNKSIYWFPHYYFSKIKKLS